MRSYTFILVMVVLNSAQVSPGGQEAKRKETAARPRLPCPHIPHNPPRNRITQDPHIL